MPDALQEPHRQLTAQQLQAPGPYLLIENTSELSWPEIAERRTGLGPVGPGKAASQGVLLHSLMANARSATDPDPTTQRRALPLLSLFDDQFHLHHPGPEVEKAPPHGGFRPHRGRPCESALWAQSLRAGATRRPVPVGRAWPTAVGPTFTSTCNSATRRAWASWCGPPRTGPRWPGRLKRRLATSSSWRGSSPGRAHFPGPCAGDGSVVRVWEETGPDVAPSLEWLLLCDQSVTDFARALSGARQYTSRWLMEDFTKPRKRAWGHGPTLQLHAGERPQASLARPQKPLCSARHLPGRAAGAVESGGSPHTQ